jgi:hypothetical protein
MRPILQLSDPTKIKRFHVEFGKELAALKPMKSASRSHKHLSFHRLSGAFFGGEAVRHEVTDFLLFTLIAGLCAWPIVSMAVAIVRVIG